MPHEPRAMLNGGSREVDHYGLRTDGRSVCCPPALYERTAAGAVRVRGQAPPDTRILRGSPAAAYPAAGTEGAARTSDLCASARDMQSTVDRPDRRFALFTGMTRCHTLRRQ
jgi:hypothetical protein